MAYTTDSIRRLMSKNDFTAEDVSYILRDENSTCIHLLDGRVITCLIPLGHFQKYLPENSFSRINKSILLCVRQVVNVNHGQYLMTDGAVLEGRHHGTKCHTDFMRRMISEQPAAPGTGLCSIQERFSAYDTMPVPFCIIQLVFDIYGRGTTFIFRYCNQMMEELHEKPLKNLINHSFCDVFENSDDTWLIRYGDVAKNGGFRIFKEYRPDLGKHVTILCYQVFPGFCGCILLEDQWMEKLESLSLK